MLTKNDLKEVKNLIDEAVAQITMAVGEALKDFATKEDLKKGLDGVENRLGHRLDGVEHRLERVEADLTDVKRDVSDLKADMPTKEDLHRKELAAYA